ncbi:MAG TPA: hypothetical protein VH187_05630 [Scandinavium sp.]|jgi:hypothetical protein|uniref:hypothetical protein n=1 Tax=Scandinavium sp. TaxID=2830653 RepID=UPI002E32D5DC|nr:hypothetical protein [Scandinavium sp.]HEX4500642.1 hypothetical protein [Scandinavium sp.]
MKVEIKRANLIDVAAVVARSNIKDQPTAERDLKRFLALSFESWAGLIDDEVAAVWGLIAPTILSDRAYLWLVTTDLAGKHPFILVRHSQMVVQDILKMFKVIEGHVIEGEARSIRWLKWLGFRMEAPHLGFRVATPRDGLIRFHLRRT